MRVLVERESKRSGYLIGKDPGIYYCRVPGLPVFDREVCPGARDKNA